MPVPEELCDGVDNTCDDVIDEGCTCQAGVEEPCFGGDEALIGIGICKEGERVCTSEGVWADCEGEVLPQTDLCNGADDDCDGAVDEDLGSTTCGKGICEVPTENCIAGDSRSRARRAEPRGETCEARTTTVRPGGRELHLHQRRHQVCYGASPATKTGHCTDGQQTCVAASGRVPGRRDASGRDLRRLDNDATARTDDGDPEGGASCATGQPGVCGAGVEHCPGGRSSASKRPAGQETCNSVDDDCDAR